MKGFLKSFCYNQKGFTLIELIVVIAITGLITGAIMVTIFQLFSISARSDSHMLAIRQVQNAGHWINLDTQMAQSVETDGGATGFPLTLTWAECKVVDGYLIEGDVYQVVYILVEEDSELRRSHSVNGGDPNITLIAGYIDSSEMADEPQTKCEFTDTDGDDINDTLFLRVTATVSGWHEVTETRVYEVTPRPD